MVGEGPNWSLLQRNSRVDREIKRYRWFQAFSSKLHSVVMPKAWLGRTVAARVVYR